MNETQHFRARTQQRCISATMVDLILDFGTSNFKGDMTLLGKKEIDKEIVRHKQLIRELQKMRSRGGAGIVHVGETMITAFHRHKKFQRD